MAATKAPMMGLDEMISNMSYTLSHISILFSTALAKVWLSA